MTSYGPGQRLRLLHAADFCGGPGTLARLADLGLDQDANNRIECDHGRLKRLETSSDISVLCEVLWHARLRQTFGRRCLRQRPQF